MPAMWLTAIWIGITGLLLTKLNINNFAMRFFRDLSRSKARKRLYGNKHALVPMLLGIEEPLNRTADDDAAENALTMTRDELATYNGQDGSPLYLSIAGRVYDVSAGERFYGKEGNYHQFVGRDATRAFATGCRNGPECISSSTEGLTEKEMREIDRWLELYDTHDKYTFVGHLVDDVVDTVIAKEEEKTKLN